MKSATFCTVLACLCAISSSALATTIVVTHTDRGWYNAVGGSQPTNLNYFAGDSRDRGCVGPGCTDDFRNYFVFDLSSIGQLIQSATLLLELPAPDAFFSADPSETYELHDVITSIPSLRDGSAGLAGHNDLGSGTIYGSRTITASDIGTTVEIELNASAISALNATHGLFGIGGSLTTLDQLRNAEVVFGHTSATEITALRLTLVPEPAANGLIAFAVTSLAMRFRRSVPRNRV